MVMVVPVDAKDHEAEQVHRNLRQEASQSLKIRARRRMQLEHHDRDQNCDDPVTERFEPRLVHARVPDRSGKPYAVRVTSTHKRLAPGTESSSAQDTKAILRRYGLAVRQ